MEITMLLFFLALSCLGKLDPKCHQIIIDMDNFISDKKLRILASVEVE